ncbi:prominin-2-like [Vanacampus margaritifer]
MKPLSPIKRVRPTRCGNAWLRAAVGLWILVHYAAANDKCTEFLDALTTATYKDWSDTPPSFLATSVTQFLSVVQPKAFPTSLVKYAMESQKNDPEKFAKFRNDVVSYIIGFVVCAVIGFLYILAMPIVGPVLACCRRADKCGGRMYQKQTPSIYTQRRNLVWSTAILTVFLFAGNICMFRSNAEFTVGLGQYPEKVNNTLDNVLLFVNNMVLQVQNLSNGINRIQINNVLDGKKLVKKAFGNLDLKDETDKMKNDVTTLKNTKKALLDNMEKVEKDLKQISASPLSTPLDGMKSAISNSKKELNKIDDASLDAIIQKVDNANIAYELKKVTDKINAIQDEVNKKLDPAKKDISNKIGEISNNLKNGSNEITKQIDGAKAKISNYQKKVDLAEGIRWPVCLVTCFVVFLVILCNFLGLILGHFGSIRQPQDPTLRSVMANQGGKTFMIGATLSFAFSWLLMLIVTVLFLLGGNLHTLVCAPWRSGELLKVLPNLIEFDLPQLGISIKDISDIYSQCQNDKSVWSALKLGEKYKEIEQQLDISAYNNLLNIGDFEMPTIAIFDAQTDRNLEQLKNVEKVKEVDTTQLDGIIQTFNNAGLKKDGQKLEGIKTTITTKINPDIVKMGTTVKRIHGTMEKLKKAQTSLDNVDDFKTNTEKIVKEQMSSFLKCLKSQVTENLGRCGPLAAAVDSAESILCFSLVSSLNAFWFSLGWCVTFFVPSIILSMKLAKYYRKMNHTDPKESDSSHSGVSMVDVETHSRPPARQSGNSVSVEAGSRSRQAARQGRSSVSVEAGSRSRQAARQGGSSGPNHKQKLKVTRN